MKWARAIPWYVWALAVLVPGGLIFLLARYKSGQGFAPSSGDVSSVARAAQVDAATRSLITGAKQQADLIRSNLTPDSLALSLIGVNPAVVDGSVENIRAEAAAAASAKSVAASTNAATAQAAAQKAALGSRYKVNI